MRKPKRHDAELPVQARELYEAMQRAFRHSMFREPDRVCSAGITVTECHSLEIVATRGPLSVGEVAASLGLNKSTASRAIASLEAKGLVSREDDACDARAWSVRATAAGRKRYGELIRDTLACYESILADYPEDTRSAVIEILRRWSAAVSCGS